MPSRPRPRTAPLSRVPSDRKSTRLNSSHANISYAVFCLKKKHEDTRIEAVCGAVVLEEAARLEEQKPEFQLLHYLVRRPPFVHNLTYLHYPYHNYSHLRT